MFFLLINNAIFTSLVQSLNSIFKFLFMNTFFQFCLSKSKIIYYGKIKYIKYIKKKAYISGININRFDNDFSACFGA